MSKIIIESDKAPQAIGPYSQAIKANGFLFVSGQIPIDPQTGKMVTASVREEAKQALENIRAILSEAKIDFSKVVKTTIFLSDMSYFAEINEVYGQYFEAPYPARETVAVKGLPRNVNVEISVVALCE